MIVDPLELIALGARLADKNLKELLPDDLFSGELAELLMPPQETMAKRLWDWLRGKGVKRVETEKHLEAIARTLKENKDRRHVLKSIRDAIREHKSGDVRSTSELREMLDKFLPHCDPNRQSGV